MLCAYQEFQLNVIIKFEVMKTHVTKFWLELGVLMLFSERYTSPVSPQLAV